MDCGSLLPLSDPPSRPPTDHQALPTPMELNLPTVALALFVIIAAFVLLRGALRILLGTLVLSASAWAAFRLWQLAPALSADWFGHPLDWLSIALPTAGFLVVFLAGRFLVRFLTSPFRKNDGERKPLTLPRLAGGALFPLLPTTLLGSVAAAIIHHAGAIAEIRQASETAAPGSASALILALKDPIAKLLPSSWLSFLDPLADPSRVDLAKIIARQSPPEPVIDPATGRPIPRAIIVDDPELDHLASNRQYADLLRSPDLTKALANPKVRKALKGHPAH